MNSFCENLTPEAKEKWMLMGTDEKLNACGELIDTFRIFGMRMCRQIYTWINEGDSRMHIPEEAIMDPLAFPSWSFGVYSAEESVHENNNETDNESDGWEDEDEDDDDAVNNDDESGEYVDMPALIDDEIVPVRLSFDDDDDPRFRIYYREQFKAMVNIQRMMRGCLERRKYKFLLYKKWISEHRLFEHGIMLFKIRKIQTAWRGYIDNQMRKHQQGSFQAATEIQRTWRGYRCRTSQNLNDINAIRSASISITLQQSINRAMTNINIIPPNSTDNLTTIEALENNINNEYHAWDNYLEINSFLHNSGLPDSITRRIMNNAFLSNYENLMDCSIDDLMWPAGGSGTHSMFTQNEANDIFLAIMRSRTHDGWGVFETVD
jgi:hypothetical protein